MSGGIARGRLTEERKSWRKNHPHVGIPYCSSSSCFAMCSVSEGFCFCFFFFNDFCVFRVLLRNRRLCLMGR